ncbi:MULTISPECIES: hypothetical protein [Enterococcus]|uniref:Replication-associated protein RepC n=1 Tax=Enterococcus alishanensis TaxID=1303817 RepID=A0ABS6TBX6_9ENTE|nr:hypothetical protein [Enterococcus alishanensis]MBV7390408.1 hypothetical protein [Enterococcus alishanensis]
MAKKMKLDSLLTANKKNKGIEKMSQYSNEEKKAPAPKPTSKELLSAKNIENTSSLRETHLLNQQKALAQEQRANREKGTPAKRGRKRQYNDPRKKALEMQKISAQTKIRLQGLIDSKFDGYTPDKVIEFLYDYYLEKELLQDDRIFLKQVEDAAMEEYKEKPKYQKLFAELENDEN